MNYNQLVMLLLLLLQPPVGVAPAYAAPLLEEKWGPAA